MATVASDVVASAVVKDGRLRFHNRRAFDEQVRRFRDGSEVEISVTIRRATRSLQQSAWYWGVIVQLISEQTGYMPDEVHDLLKAKFIPKRLAVTDGNGEIVDEFVLGGSTRKLNTIEFSEYCEAIRQWAAEKLDCYIPDPSEHGYGAGI
jgi:hypothetical protein